MSGLYSGALAITVLLGFILSAGYVYKHFDEITQAFDNVTSWSEENGLKILASIFLLSLAVTILAGIGLV